MNTPPAELLFPPLVGPAPDGRTVINPSLWFVDRDGYRVVFCRHEPLYRLALDDLPHLRYVAVMLRQSELATQEELAYAFGHSVAAQRRWERRYQHAGLDGLDHHPSTGRHRKLDKTQEQFVRRWFQQGLSQADCARRLGVGAATIARVCQRLGLHRPVAAMPELPWDGHAADPTVSAPLAGVDAAPGGDTDRTPAPVTPLLAAGASPALPTTATPRVTPHADTPSVTVTLPQDTVPAPTSADPHDPNTTPAVTTPALATEPAVTTPALATEPAVTTPALATEPARLPQSFTLDHDPHDRHGDRLLARLGMLADALPLFADDEHVPRAGVLLAVPLLAEQGVVSLFEQVYGSLRPAFYGLRTVVVTLLLMALLRIKRPENLKEYAPNDLGCLLGLDRAPEVKTVRRKLTELAARGLGKELMDALARQRLAQQDEALAFFYVDGHVREYHGKEPLAKTKKAQSALPKPAATDYWVNDAQGVPLLVVTHPMNAALTQVLLPILRNIKALVPPGQRITVLFDRGGFSAQLFRLLIDEGFDVITYRKGRRRLLPRRRFTEHTLPREGRCLTYHLYDQARVRVGRLHPPRRPRRRGAPPQFLWMRQVTVLREQGGQTPVLTNRTDLAAALVVYRLFGRWRQENYFKYMDAEFALDALVEYGVDDVPATADRPNPRRRPLQKRLQLAKAEVVRLQAALGAKAACNAEGERPTMRGFKIAHADLRQQLQAAEARVRQLKQRLRQLPPRIPASDLKTLKKEKKLIVDALKMTAYQIETRLLGMLDAQYARTQDEGRTLLHAAFQSTGRVEVLPEALRVTLAAQSSPHRTAALSALCAEVNALGQCFPGTNLRLQLAVEPHQPLTP